MTKPKYYKYPNPDFVSINEADFKIHMNDFGEANRTRVSFKDILIIVPAWVVIFTAKFNEIGGISGLTLMGFYAALMVCGTLIYIIGAYPQIKHWIRKIIFINLAFRWLGKKIFIDCISERKRLNLLYEKYKYETDPTKKAEGIKEMCGVSDDGVPDKKNLADIPDSKIKETPNVTSNINQ